MFITLMTANFILIQDQPLWRILLEFIAEEIPLGLDHCMV